MTTANIARTDDGTIQINFSIPKADIDKAQQKALVDAAKDITVPGFRKGKAPEDKIKERVDPGKLLEKTLGQILPQAYTKAITDNKIVPIIYPKFEIIKQGEVWEVQAKIAELPKVELGDYKTVIKAALKAESKKKDLVKQEREEIVIKTLVQSIKIQIPKIVIDEEVNMRLSALLDRTEKLGLKLEQYLASIGKTEKTIREEYEEQVSNGIAIELILNKAAEVDKIVPKEEDVDTAIQTSGVTEVHEGHIEEQKQLVRSVLKRRIVLDQLTNLS